MRWSEQICQPLRLFFFEKKRVELSKLLVGAHDPDLSAPDGEKKYTLLTRGAVQCWTARRTFF